METTIQTSIYKQLLITQNPFMNSPTFSHFSTKYVQDKGKLKKFNSMALLAILVYKLADVRTEINELYKIWGLIVYFLF